MDRTFFKLFFLCEDGEAMNRALALKEKLAKNCRDQVIIDADFYEYVRLSHPHLRENALAHVAGADMIIITAKGTEALPGFIQEWMNEIGNLRPGNIVCAEFLGATSPEKAATFHGFMDKWAERFGSFLFSNLFPNPKTGGTVSGCFLPSLTPS